MSSKSCQIWLQTANKGLYFVKVLRINARFASLAILCVGDTPLKQSFAGIIRCERKKKKKMEKIYSRLSVSCWCMVRFQDITSSAELGKLQMQQLFRPGDVVLARVLSLGDRRNFYLTTAASELGVIYAKSEDADAPLVPISWNSMQCSETGVVESRKVARIVAIVDDAETETAAGEGEPVDED